MVKLVEFERDASHSFLGAFRDPVPGESHEKQSDGITDGHVVWDHRSCVTVEIVNGSFLGRQRENYGTTKVCVR